MHCFSRLTFSVILLTTSASFAQAQSAEPKGLKAQSSAIQSMTGGGTSAKPSDPVAQNVPFGSSKGGPSVASFTNNSSNSSSGVQSANSGSSLPEPNRTHGAAGKKGFQDALNDLRKDRRLLEADRKKLKYDRKVGDAEAITKSEQKLKEDGKTILEKVDKARQEEAAQREQREAKKKAVASEKL
ncbi:MAG: hypothetical protein EBY21_13875 [Alphaproteobacteria bacterium]|nr:hypothetical protein [Alphaproteobacteria bacterium]